MKDQNLKNSTCLTNSSDKTLTEVINEGKTAGSPSPKRK